MVILLTGVSGVGKSAVGERLAARLGWVFHDGDDAHPPANVRKMAAGVPLTDDDRAPWLAQIRELIARHEEDGTSAVIACSALKRSYRRRLLAGTRETRVVFLSGRRELLEERLRARRGHFFDPRLLASQLATLEEPTDAVTIDVDDDLDAVTAAVAAALGLREEARAPGRRRSR